MYIPWNLDGIQESHIFQLWKIKNRTSLWWDNVSNLCKNNLYLVKLMYTIQHTSFHAGDWIYWLFMHQACVLKIKHNTKRPIVYLLPSSMRQSQNLMSVKAYMRPFPSFSFRCTKNNLILPTGLENQSPCLLTPWLHLLWNLLQ